MEEIIDVITVEENKREEILRVLDNHYVLKRRARNCIAARKCRKKKEEIIKILIKENEELRTEIKLLKGRLFQFTT
jgi:hypothetical protein